MIDQRGSEKLPSTEELKNVTPHLQRQSSLHFSSNFIEVFLEAETKEEEQEGDAGESGAVAGTLLYLDLCRAWINMGL